jgi:hypothetical protein
MPLIAATWLPDITCCLLRIDQRRYLRLVDVYAPAATVWAPAVATLGISEAEPISRRTAAVRACSSPTALVPSPVAYRSS